MEAINNNREIQRDQSNADSRHLAQFSEMLMNQSSLRISIEADSGQKADISLPRQTLELIASVLREVSHGRSVRIVSSNAEITTQQAADILNISRPHLIKLLSQHAIPYRSVGTRRRILVDDVLAYRETEAAKRLAGVDLMVSESQKLGLY